MLGTRHKSYKSTAPAVDLEFISWFSDALSPSKVTAVLKPAADDIDFQSQFGSLLEIGDWGGNGSVREIAHELLRHAWRS